MEYGFFRNKRNYTHHIYPLRGLYESLKWIPNINILYDRAGGSRLYYSKLLSKLGKNDILYITHIYDLGETTNTIMSELKVLEDLEVKVYILPIGIRKRVSVDSDKFIADQNYYYKEKYLVNKD